MYFNRTFKQVYNVHITSDITAGILGAGGAIKVPQNCSC